MHIAILFVLTLTFLLLLSLYILLKLCKLLIVKFLGVDEWDVARRGFFIVGSIVCIALTCHRLYYFHDEMIDASTKGVNPSYSDQIQVETYLMSHQNVIDLFEGNPPKPDTVLKYKGPWRSPMRPIDPRFYLVVRLKNNGDQTAWGVLDFIVDGKRTRKIDIPPIAPHATDFKNIVLISTGSENDTDNYPELRSEWDRLYTKVGEKNEN